MHPIPNNLHRELGQRLRLLRKARGLSQIQVAQQMGVAFQQVQKYERGINKLSFERIWQLSAILHVNIDYWIKPFETELAGNTSDIFHDRATLYLVQAFNRIQKPRARRLISSLVRELASC